MEKDKETSEAKNQEESNEKEEERTRKINENNKYSLTQP